MEGVFAELVHDLKGPLSALLGFSEVLRRREQCIPCGCDCGRLGEAVGRQAKRLHEIIARIACHPQTLSLQKDGCELIGTLRRLVTLYEDRFHRFEIRLRVDSDAIFGRWDEPGLEQVFGNLLENGLKYSHNKRALEIDITHGAESVTVAIRDHGIGIPAKERPLLFMRGFRGHAARQSGVDGMGLGLHVVERIVASMGGAIWVESPPDNVGTIFMVRLPLSPPGGEAHRLESVDQRLLPGRNRQDDGKRDHRGEATREALQQSRVGQRGQRPVSD